MLQIGYFSTAAGVQDAKTVHDILIQARVNNRRDKVTGLLTAGGNRYIQIIEGPAFAVEGLYERIRKDPRHLAVSTLIRRKIANRSFDNWSMAFHREPELDQFDTFPEALRHLTAHVSDDELRAKIRKIAHVFIVEPRFEVPAAWPLAS